MDRGPGGDKGRQRPAVTGSRDAAASLQAIARPSPPRTASRRPRRRLVRTLSPQAAAATIDKYRTTVPAN